MKFIYTLSLALLFLLGTRAETLAQSADFTGLYTQSYADGNGELRSRVIKIDFTSNQYQGEFRDAEATGMHETQFSLDQLSIQNDGQAVSCIIDGEVFSGNFSGQGKSMTLNLSSGQKSMALQKFMGE
ncbi:MAG: hypothetical protein H6581_02140 [Bacteroidia bacterium]|nr:hypothetical protein [Bacteroidia bacterium]